MPVVIEVKRERGTMLLMPVFIEIQRDRGTMFLMPVAIEVEKARHYVNVNVNLVMVC